MGVSLSAIVKRQKIKAALAFIALVLLTSLSCGKRKPPLPPTEKIPQRVEVSGFQRGNQIILSWKMPAKNVGKGSLLNISRADIYRLAEPSTSPLTLTEEEFASRSTIIATVPITDSDFGPKPITYTDTLEFAGQAVRLRYAIRLANAQGQKAAFSNFLLIEPEIRVAENPTDLKMELTQDAVKLSWTAPVGNVDGSTPARLIGYNIYRSTSKNTPAKLLNKTPVTETKFSDEFFEFEQEYFYFVRGVSLGGSSTPIESTESNIVRIFPKDTFAPSAPSAITIAASTDSISLFFAINHEKDIAGYRIYRSTDETLEKSKWTLLTEKILETTTYEDKAVEAGKTYFYYITAVDKTGNVSAPSEVVSETIQESNQEQVGIWVSRPALERREDKFSTHVVLNNLECLLSLCKPRGGEFFMPNVLVRDVKLPILQKLKNRALKNGRSLQSEVEIILRDAVERKKPLSDLETVREIRASLMKKRHSDSAESLREDRKR